MTQQAIPVDQLLDELRVALHRYQSRKRRRSLYALAIAAAGVTASVALGATYGHWWSSPNPFRAVARPFAVPTISGHDLLTGKHISTADFAGRAGFLLVWRYDGWCPPCKGELAAVQAFATANPQIPIVGLDFIDSPALGKATLKQTHATSFPSISVNASTWLKLKILRGFPEILAFNAKGNIVAIASGYGGRTQSDVLASEAARISH
jgi:thiol-disulfide isomerase/thioredoxin